MLDTTQLDAALRSGGVAATLDQLAQHFQAQQQWHELFDTRLMQARQSSASPSPVVVRSMNYPAVSANN